MVGTNDIKGLFLNTTIYSVISFPSPMLKIRVIKQLPNAKPPEGTTVFIRQGKRVECLCFLLMLMLSLSFALEAVEINCSPPDWISEDQCREGTGRGICLVMYELETRRLLPFT